MQATRKNANRKYISTRKSFIDPMRNLQHFLKLPDVEFPASVLSLVADAVTSPRSLQTWRTSYNNEKTFRSSSGQILCTNSLRGVLLMTLPQEKYARRPTRQRQVEKRSYEKEPLIFYFNLYKVGKNATITGHFGFNLCLRKIRSGKLQDCRDVAIFEKLTFPSTRKRKAGVFKFLRLEERIWKALFSWRISADS